MTAKLYPPCDPIAIMKPLALSKNTIIPQINPSTVNKTIEVKSPPNPATRYTPEYRIAVWNNPNKIA
jgi:hypothetical protein